MSHQLSKQGSYRSTNSRGSHNLNFDDSDKSKHTHKSKLSSLRGSHKASGDQGSNNLATGPTSQKGSQHSNPPSLKPSSSLKPPPPSMSVSSDKKRATTQELVPRHSQDIVIRTSDSPSFEHLNSIEPYSMPTHVHLSSIPLHSSSSSNKEPSPKFHVSGLTSIPHSSSRCASVRQDRVERMMHQQSGVSRAKLPDPVITQTSP